MKKKKKQLLTLVVVLSALLSVWQVGPINAEGPPPPEPPQPGSITAHKFHDGNGNGVQDAGEEDLPGWPMRIYRWDQSPVLVAEGSTNDSGAVTFDGLEPGRYKVWEADQECWQPTTPGGNHWNGGYYQVVHLAEGKSVTVQFGNRDTCEPSPPPPPETCIDLEKTGPETANPGETITYHFWVHNCGELVLHGGAQVYDPLFGDAPIWDGDLEPGEIHEFDMAYTLLDDHCGNFTNNAWAVGHPPEYPEVRDDDSWTVVVICEPQPNPSIDVEKYVSVDDQATWHDADTPPGPEAIAGSETVWFRFVVTNDGDATLTGVTLSDTDFNAEIASQCTVPTSLAPGESFTCLIGPFVAIEGQHMNTGTTTGNYEGQPYSDTDRAKYFGTPPEPQPGVIIVEKQTDPDGSTQSFEFSPSYGSNFSLADDETNNSGPLTPGVYSVSEINIPANWNLTSATCNDGSDPSAIGLGAGETVKCTFTNILVDFGCTYTQGYWKNHPEAWPVATLMLGTVSYNQAELLSIFDQSVGGNGLISLAHQLIAAKLNAANGAFVPVGVAAAIADADTLIDGLVVPPIGTGYLAPSATSTLTNDLDQYNQGLYPGGPPHCDGGCEDDCDDGDPCTIDTCVDGECVHTPLEHAVTLDNVIYDSGTTTLQYIVTSGCQPSISHWILELGECHVVLDASPDPWEAPFDDTGPFGTGISGIKWDVDFDDGETKIFQVTLAGQWEIDNVAWGIKAGQEVSTGQVTGPTCQPFTMPLDAEEVSQETAPGPVQRAAPAAAATAAATTGLAGIAWLLARRKLLLP